MLSRINMIGCGRLGKAVGKLLVTNHKAIINGVLATTHESASKSVSYIGQGIAYRSIEDLIPADIHFIATSDDAIQTTCEKLVATGVLQKGNLVIHFSGVHSSDVLVSAKLQGCDVASIHPIKSFANPTEAFNSFGGTYCALEGYGDKLGFLAKLFEDIGGVIIKINKEHKAIYHAAGVMANNYLVTLHHQAVECYKTSGIDEETAKNITTSLMMGALANLKKFTHKESLTGPIQRGDKETIKKHTSALQSDQSALSVYSTLGKATLELTEHSEEKKKSLIDILNIGQQTKDGLFELKEYKKK